MHLSTPKKAPKNISQSYHSSEGFLLGLGRPYLSGVLGKHLVGVQEAELAEKFYNFGSQNFVLSRPWSGTSYNSEVAVAQAFKIQKVWGPGGEAPGKILIFLVREFLF